MSVLSARGLVKRFGHVTALDGADFDLAAGEILAVIGDNGAGKSSLIKVLSGALVPDEGELRLDGAPVHFRSPLDARRAGIETVYQDLAVAPALSIAENLFLGREMRRAGVLGGTSLFGGRGVIVGSLVGALIVGVFRNGLTLIGVTSVYQILVTGILVILAVATDQLSRRGAR